MKEERVKEAYDEIDLYEYLRVIWRWRWLIVTGVIVATLAAIPAAYLMRTYESHGVLRLSEALQLEELIQPSEQGNRGIIVSLPEYKIYSATLTDSQAFLDYLNRHELFSGDGMASVQGLTTRTGLQDNIKPLYAYTEKELKSLRPDEQLVSAILLSWEGPSPEQAQRIVEAMGLFVKDAIGQKIMEKYVNHGYQETYFKVQEFERRLIDLKFSLKQNEQKLAELKKIAQRVPAGEQLSNREVVSVEKGGYRYLPPSTQMVAAEVEIADTHLAIANTERQLKVNQLKLEFFVRLKEALHEEIAGSLFARLEEIKEEFFQQKDTRKDEVLIVRNEISADFSRFEYWFHDAIQFISGPTLPHRAKPSKRIVVAVTFFMALFFFIFLAFFLEFIQRGRRRERIPEKQKKKSKR